VGPPGGGGAPRLDRTLASSKPAPRTSGGRIIAKMPGADHQAKVQEQEEAWSTMQDESQVPPMSTLDYGFDKIAFSHISRFGNQFQLPGLPNEIYFGGGVVQRVTDQTLLEQLVNWTLAGADAQRGKLAPIAVYSVDISTESPLWQKYEENAAYLQTRKRCTDPALSRIYHAEGRLSKATSAMLEGVVKHNSDMEKTSWFTDPYVNEQVLAQSMTVEQAVAVLYEGYTQRVRDIEMTDGASTVSEDPTMPPPTNPSMDPMAFGNGYYFYGTSGMANKLSPEGWPADQFAAFMHGNVGQFTQAFARRASGTAESRCYKPPSSARGVAGNVPKSSETPQLPAGGLKIRTMLLSRVMLGCPAMVNALSWNNKETEFDNSACDGPPGENCSEAELKDPFTSIKYEGASSYRSQFVTRLPSLQIPAFLVFYVEEPCQMQPAK
tara:strand:+ start:1016 stop:2326 length:1311 start_codon:yes stop_codon:yes gene_type:complete